MDTTVVLRDVFVPWEQVFIYRNVELVNRSSTTSARERIKVLRLIWDLVGTEFAGRQLQYEMFYSASQPVVNTRMFRSYDWAGAKALVDRCLGEY